MSLEMKEKNVVGVSVLCLAYNHEPYIADAIEGFLKQETSFPIEIIIHEDASTDRTAEVIREYEIKYPEIIRPIYQKKNQYSQGVNINNEFMLPIARGKYVALCDGDDFWTDPLKLQKQYDAMETHPECLMCLHKVRDYNVLRGNDQEIIFLPKTYIPTGVINSSAFFSIYGKNDFFNEVCYFFKADAYREYQENYPEFAKLFMKNKTDDAPMLYYFAYKADVYYIADEMAVYRRFTSGSWSDTMSRKDLSEQSEFFRNSLDAQNAFDAFSEGKYHDELTYSRMYSNFNYDRCMSHYRDMLDPKYDIVWEKQSKRYRKRIKLLARYPHIASVVFRIYDMLRQTGK